VKTYLGIDPSKRHTGLALSKDEVSLPVLREIAPTERDLLTSVRSLRIDLYSFMKEHAEGTTELVIGIEKQGMGGESAVMLFNVQMAIFETLGKFCPDIKVIWPLPGQLKSYLKRLHAVDISSKTSIVRSWADTHGRLFPKKRYSSHLVEAYYMMRAAKDVQGGKWSYRPTSNEDPTTLIPFKVDYGVEFNGRVS